MGVARLAARRLKEGMPMVRDKKTTVGGTAPSSVGASIIVRSTELGRLTSMAGKGTPEQLREAIRRTLAKAR